jgi:DNA-binding response OmpR family regulator
MSCSPAEVWLLEDRGEWQEVAGSLESRLSVRCFSSTAALESRLASGEPRPALLVADVKAPDRDLFPWLARPFARDQLEDVPLIVMSEIDDADLVRSAFAHGAVDFVSKPFGPAVFAVKVERFVGRPLTKARCGAVPTLDVRRMAVRASDGRTASLTAKEMQILSLLWDAPSNTLTRDTIGANLWPDCRVGPRTVDVHLSRLRQKLRTIGIDLRSSRGRNIRLSMPTCERCANSTMHGPRWHKRAS